MLVTEAERVQEFMLDGAQVGRVRPGGVHAIVV